MENAEGREEKRKGKEKEKETEWEDRGEGDITWRNVIIRLQ